MKHLRTVFCFIIALATVISAFSFSVSANSDLIRGSFEDYSYQGVTDIYYDGIFSYFRSSHPDTKAIVTDYNVLYNGYLYYYEETTECTITTIYLDIYPSDNNHIFVSCFTVFSIDDTELGYLSLSANSWVNDDEEPED